jgi:hypothetical protein
MAAEATQQSAAQAAAAETMNDWKIDGTQRKFA